MKVGLFTEPDLIVSQFLAMWKEEVRVLFGDQPYLSHPPHNTLFTLDIDENRDEWIAFEEGGFDLPFPFSSFNLEFTEPLIFFDDPLTLGHTLTLKIKLTDELSTMQMNLLNFFQKFRNKTPLTYPLKSVDWMSRNYETYGFPFVGTCWLPHMTISSVITEDKNHPLIQRFKQCDFKFVQKTTQISLWEINGDFHKRLTTWSFQ